MHVNNWKMDYRSFLCFIPCLYILATIVPPSTTLNFDSATSCNPKLSRKGRAQLLASIPCDLRHQAYCNLPGPSYPWHAVRRFVHENQGLMKRMYGDVRHISILRTEFQNNEIDVDDIEEAAARYSRNGFRRRTNKLLHADFQNIRNNDVLSEPHFRPTSTTTTSTTASPPPSTPEAVTTEKQNETAAVAVNPTMSETDPDNNLESNSIVDTSTSNPSTDNIKVVPSPNLTRNKTESATISTTLRVVQQIIKSEIEAEQASEKDTDARVSETQAAEAENETIRPEVDTPAIEADSKISNSSVEQPSKPEFGNPGSLMAEINKVNENFIDKKKRPATMEGQLFQDTVDKETVQVGANSRGVNACPVKEEVVAPFWANNTRGEVLALLNLYPFEQYVHWEKCTHEHKQMYCRDGCRCEQQYRLHRLLAYDPHNECRGIFSDWFRFPSCCICKCYDIPLEFRSTSRSPRTLQQDKESHRQDGSGDQHPVDLAEDEVQRAIYEHATEDWYRPRDEFDFYED